MSPVSNQPEPLKHKRTDSASTADELQPTPTVAETVSPRLVRPPSRPPGPVISEKPLPANESEPRPYVPPVPEVVVPPEDPEFQDGRLRPIPPPSEPTQYRAIGVVRGTYQPSEEQYTRGEMLMADGSRVEAVLLGRVMSLVKNHLALDQEHVWVVYPRTRERESTLHLQIVGVWEPENLTQNTPSGDSEGEGEEATPEPAAETTGETPTYVSSSEVEADTFSIRGEIVLHEPEHNKIVVKIQQALRKKGEKDPASKFFKLNLEGDLHGKVLGYFWDLKVKRSDQALMIQSGTSITLVMPRKYPKRPGMRRPGGPGGGMRRPGGPGGFSGGRGGDRPFTPRSTDGPPPVRKEGATPPPKPVIKKRSDGESAGESSTAES